MQTLTPTPTLTWLPITPELRSRYLACVAAASTQSADYAFSNLYLWDETYHQALVFVGARAVVRFENPDGTHRYLFPIGEGPLEPVLKALQSEARAEGAPLCFVGVTEKQKKQLLAIHPYFDTIETRDYFDYLYTANALASLSGKKLHGKRNHINAFSAAHTYEVHALTPADFDACRHILSMWDAARDEEGVEDERRAVLRAFEAFQALDLLGAVLIADGIAVAFTIGAMITSDTFCVHFEKALPTWESAYPVINRAFVRMVLERHPEILYINREDDMGLDNLRAAKLSYRPTQLLAKYALIAQET